MATCAPKTPWMSKKSKLQLWDSMWIIPGIFKESTIVENYIPHTYVLHRSQCISVRSRVPCSTVVYSNWVRCYNAKYRDSSEWCYTYYRRDSAGNAAYRRLKSQHKYDYFSWEILRTCFLKCLHQKSWCVIIHLWDFVHCLKHCLLVDILFII